MTLRLRIALLAAVLFIGGISLSFNRLDNEFEISKNLEIFVSIFRELNAFYVDDLNADKLVKTGIDAMLASLDPYTTYINEEDMGDFNIQTTGKYGGIGALIRTQDKYVIIAEPYEGSPAQRAGILAGDKLIEIDGKSAKGKNTDDVSKLLKGMPGTMVRLLIERFGESKPIEKTIRREEIHLKSVPYFGMVDSKTGYFRLNSFTEDCGKDVAKALETLKKQYNAQQIIFDLRDNPGGLLHEAVNVANVFIPRNEEVVSTRGREREWQKSYKTSSSPIDTNIPLVVLIDEGAASASEIVSGTIQDLDRGVVIGERSFGKGLVQSTKNIGYNGKLKVTTAKYYLPSGRCIQEIDYSTKDPNHRKMPDSLHTAFKTRSGRTVYDTGGIKPDIELEKPYYGSITAALLSKQLIFDYATQYRATHPTLPTPDKFELSEDEYNDFVKFLSNKEYDYTTGSQQILKDFKESAAKEKYFDALSPEYIELEKHLKSDKAKDLVKYKDEIKDLLEIEIATRYYWQAGTIQEALEDDIDVKKAIETLNNPAAYQKLLKGNK